MFCPQCGSEYRQGFTHCNDCDVDLVWELPREEPEDINLVKVFETTNPVLVPTVESLLNSADIQCVIRNKFAHHIFASEVFSIRDPTQFWVRDRDAQDARELLADLSRYDDPGQEPE